MQQQVKARPIIFSEAMVKLVLDDKKPLTRRIIRPDLSALFDPGRGPEDTAAGYPFVELDGFFVIAHTLCPYGRPGDHLWVRESWRGWLAGDCPCIEYRYGGDPMGANSPRPGYDVDHPAFRLKPKWRGARFMPRWASRIDLEILNVRAERLQEISYDDCCLELGAPVKWEGEGTEPYHRDMRRFFAEAWDKINGKRGYTWESNPWVWRIEFKRIHEPWRTTPEQRAAERIIKKSMKGETS